MSASARARNAASACCGVEVAERGVQQVQPFADAAPRQPQRLQRGRELQGEPGIAVLAAPRKRGAQVVDLDLDLGQTAPVVSPPRGVEHRGHRRVVVAVTRTHAIGLAGLLQFLGAVLAHRVQQPVTRCAAGTVGHHQRLVDEQAELIEDLVTARCHRPRRPPARRRGRSHPQTPPAGETTPARSRSTAHATSPPRRARFAGGAPRCAHRRSTTGTGHAGRRGSRPATTRAPAPPPARSPAADHPGARRSRPPRRRRRCRRRDPAGHAAPGRRTTRRLHRPATTTAPANSAHQAHRWAHDSSPARSAPAMRPGRPRLVPRSHPADARRCPTPPAAHARRQTRKACPSWNGPADRAARTRGPPPAAPAQGR